MASDVLPSLSRMMIGFIGAVVIGVVVGFVLGQAHRLQAMFAPVLEFLRAIPAVALIPLVIIVLGLDDTAKVMLITFICLWPVLLNTEAAIRGMDPGLRETARVYGIHWFRYELQVALPAAAPQIFAGMRTSLSLALIMVVVSEMMAGGNGIGVFVLQSQRSFAITDMWSGIVLIGIFGYVFNLLLIVVENRVLAWHHGANTAVE
jgi:ABC-type nitrate/sulfonate/bicarbonate transport system permease component